MRVAGWLGLVVLGALPWVPAWAQDDPQALDAAAPEALDLEAEAFSPDSYRERQPWIMPFDVAQRYRDDIPGLIESQFQVYNFMWRTFVALNWPQRLGGARAEPDVEGHLAPWGPGEQSEGPVVWESYRRPNEVFIKPKKWPIYWNDPPETLLALCPPVNGVEGITISSFTTNYSDNSDGLNQPFTQANYPTGPVADQNGNYLRYEVGLNQSYFTYIGHYRYFKPSNQRKAVERYIDYVRKNDKAPEPSVRRDARFFQELPKGRESYLDDLPDYARQGIVEWKVAWKILDGDDVPERFYRRVAYFLNPDSTCTGPFLVGLVGFHIHRYTPFGHVGATFEQVDNTNLQRDYSARRVSSAAKLPPHPSLNPNPSRRFPANYPNGYAVCDSEGDDCETGKAGIIPKPLEDGDLLPLDPQITAVSRQVPIPHDVQASNERWRRRLEGTVWFYYQMIGTDNPNIREPNRHLGPGVTGAQEANVTNLINTTLESYTQKGWSCSRCHLNAFPHGVTLPLPPIEQEYAPLHIISFLLLNARGNKSK